MYHWLPAHTCCRLALSCHCRMHFVSFSVYRLLFVSYGNAVRSRLEHLPEHQLGERLQRSLFHCRCFWIKATAGSSLGFVLFCFFLFSLSLLHLWSVIISFTCLLFRCNSSRIKFSALAEHRNKHSILNRKWDMWERKCNANTCTARSKVETAVVP